MDDFGHNNTPGLFGMLDVAMKSNLRITDDEYDHISEVSTDDDFDILMDEHPTFAVRRKIIQLLNKLIIY